MRTVKTEMGEDAVILHTRTKKRPALLGLSERTEVEVLAAVDLEAPAQRRASLPQAQTAKRQASPSKTSVEPAPVAAVASAPEKLEKRIDSLHLKVDAVWREVRERASRAASLEETAFVELLEANGVVPEVAKEVLAEAKGHLPAEWSEEDLERTLTAAVEERLRTSWEMEQRGPARVLCFVGPTGSGKTTTIAKLAGDFALIKRKKVALVTADTYRIAAVDQLRVYADILDVPLTVVNSPAEMGAALRAHRHADVILVDTAGRSHRNEGALGELKLILEAAKALEVHLVLPVTAEQRWVCEVLERYCSIGPHRLLFTKLDEACCFGSILNATATARLPISYVTNGQNVPEDFATPTSADLARLVLGAPGNGEGRPNLEQHAPVLNSPHR